MRRRQMMQKVSRISLCVVIGLLFLALIWKFAGAQLAKKGIVLSNDTAAKTVSETAPRQTFTATRQRTISSSVM